MKTVHCACGFKFQAHDNSLATTCFDCLKKIRVDVTKKKPLDVAFEIMDRELKKKGWKKKGA